jgi:cell division septation protein DedD
VSANPRPDRRRRAAGRTRGRARPLRTLSLVGLLAGALAGPAPAPVAGQGLERVDSLTAAGRVQEAREELMAWLEGPGARSPSREETQRAIWLRGILTLDAAQAALDYTRLVVEYPGGPFTDGALLRLAQAAELENDLPRARRHFEELARDHPRSPLRPQAREWLDAHPPGRDPAPPVNRSPPVAAEPAPGAAPAAAAPERRPPPSRPAPAAGPYAVQLGAFADSVRARTLAQRALDAGFEPRLVTTPGTELVRVRVGRFTGAGEATALYDRLRAGGFEAMVVADADRERAVPGAGEPPAGYSAASTLSSRWRTSRASGTMSSRPLTESCISGSRIATTVCSGESPS